MSVALIGIVGLTTLLMIGVLIAVVDTDRDGAGSSEPAARNSNQLLPRLAVAASAGVLVVAASGWLVPAFVIAVATWHFVARWQARSPTHGRDIETTDALASWIENLRDVLLAGDQPIGAISATVPTAPPIIRPAVRRLAAALGHQSPDLAFRRFADEIDDPLGDLVAAGLLIAVERGARTVAVLTSLAAQARTNADRRRIVEAERAPIQREVMLLSAIMGSLVVALIAFGRRDYLDAYDSGGGQLFLTVVLAIYALLLIRVQRLARFPKPSRFITAAGARQVVGSHR